MSLVVLNMSQFSIDTFERNWEELISESFPIVNYSGKLYCEFSRFSDFFPIFVITKWTTLLVDIHCPRGSS